MPRPTYRHVLTQIERLEKFINDWEMTPATADPRNRVFLALLSKALTVSRAICALVKAGFPTEAFAMSRTLIDVFFCIRYLSNKDTASRITTYVEFAARVQQEWLKINDKYYPNRPLKLPAYFAEAMEIAKKFKSRHHWTEHGGQAKIMALEPDTSEVNAHGQPVTSEFDYDALYFWTSQYVHVTINALEGHGIEPGNVFRVRSNISVERDYSRLALSNTVTFLTKIFIQACRGMQEEQPARILNKMLAMMKELAR